MRTDMERIALLHERARELRRQKDKRMLVLTGTASLCLLALLLAGMAKTVHISEHYAEGGFSGASMFGDGAGGYVLVAVIAFVAAVAVTLVCMHLRNSREKENNKTYDISQDRRNEK